MPLLAEIYINGPIVVLYRFVVRTHAVYFKNTQPSTDSLKVELGLKIEFLCARSCFLVFLPK